MTETKPITITISRRLAYAIGLVVAIGALALASSLFNRGAGAAEDRASRYLAALAQEDAATAWPLLTHRARTVWGSYDAFEDAVQAASWSEFEYEIVDSHCDDGICAVDLRIPNGPTSVPRMLHEGPTHYWWGPSDALVFSDQFVTGGKEIAIERGVIDARIVVIFGIMPWDDTGIG